MVGSVGFANEKFTGQFEKTECRDQSENLANAPANETGLVDVKDAKMRKLIFFVITALLFTPAAVNAQKITVRAISHSMNENDYTITSPQTTNTDCSLYPNSVNCTSTTYGGNTQRKAVYRFTEIVTVDEGGKVTQYTLTRVARWVWNSMDWLTDGDFFPAEIKGKHMFVICRRGGNQGKKVSIKYDILDIRPAPQS
jgi:hypothetical protein